GVLERVLQLDQRLGPERVAHLGPVERDARDPVRLPVRDVRVFLRGLPARPLGHAPVSVISSPRDAPRPRRARTRPPPRGAVGWPRGRSAPPAAWSRPARRPAPP